jgi:starch synthase (maltosyl-transferring)
MLRQQRVVIDRVEPQINCGSFYIKRVVGQHVDVSADVLVDGHDVIAACVVYKHEKDRTWKEQRMSPGFNDTWHGSFTVTQQGFYEYKVQGWVDHPLNWQYGIGRKIADHQHVKSELLEGALYLEEIKHQASEREVRYLDDLIIAFRDPGNYDWAIEQAVSDELKTILEKYPSKHLQNSSEPLRVYVDRKKALFSTWYEFFPRSSSPHKGVHGTFRDCENLLERVVEMGFDTLYFPPIHPIGEVNRKGKNNTTDAMEGDVGSCWGIGSRFGGHKDIHPDLGTLDDFKNLVAKAKDRGLEVAMDYALQAAPDHPWVKEHGSWFKWRPDGTVQYAENPPKKYQDILPLYFESEDYESLWQECLDILLFWIDCGINIFRVDNPHTKPYYFWSWIIEQVKSRHPDVLFLAEAFTKPKVMQQLAKQGYTQSYTYFTWRESKQELISYVEELTKTEQSEYMRPNFWPNTPDINPYHLQGANESKFIQRYALAATLSSNIGIYGPVYEYMISEPLEGREEYLNSEKFQVCHYDWSRKNWLIKIITGINKARNELEALQQTNNIRFCEIQNDEMMAFYKWSDDRSSEVLVVISLDNHHSRQGFVQLPLDELGIAAGHNLKLRDVVPDVEYTWDREWNFVELHPNMPFHIFEINKM